MQVAQAEASAAFDKYPSGNFFLPPPSAGDCNANSLVGHSQVAGQLSLQLMHFCCCCRASEGEGVFFAVLGSVSKGRRASAWCQSGI